MQYLTTKTGFQFDPAPVAAAIDATGNAYSTPSAHRVTLGGLGMLAYVRSQVKAAVVLSAASSAGAGTLEVVAGGSVIGSVAVDFTDARTDAVIDLDLSGVSPTTPVYLRLVVDTAADASTTALVYGSMECETPFMSLGC